MPTKKLFAAQNAWAMAIVLAGLTLLIGEIINERFWMHDLEVYYRTAARMLQSEEIYRIASDGHYVYKYSPTAGLYFIPLTLLPFSAAKIFFWILLVLLSVAVLQVLYQMAARADIHTSPRHKNTVLLLAFLAVGAHVHREWHLGQVNFVLLALYILLLVCWRRAQHAAVGVILAASLFIKPFGLIFLPYLVLRRNFSALLATGVTVVLLGLLPFVLYPSAEAFAGLYNAWFQELLIELGAKQDLLQSGNHTIFSVLARYTPLQFILTSEAAIKLYQLSLLALIALYILYFVRTGARLRQRTVYDVAVLVAFIPLFAVTSLNAFLFTLPCMVLLLYHFAGLPKVARILTVAGCLLVGINIRDLMGGELYRFLESISIYTFGTMALLAALTMLRLKQARQQENAQHGPKRNKLLQEQVSKV